VSHSLNAQDAVRHLQSIRDARLRGPAVAAL